VSNRLAEIDHITVVPERGAFVLLLGRRRPAGRPAAEAINAPCSRAIPGSDSAANLRRGSVTKGETKKRLTGSAQLVNLAAGFNLGSLARRLSFDGAAF
jgi:hypothetical protein